MADQNVSNIAVPSRHTLKSAWHVAKTEILFVGTSLLAAGFIGSVSLAVPLSNAKMFMNGAIFCFNMGAAAFVSERLWRKLKDSPAPAP